MAFAPNNDLKRAIDALDIFRVWAAAYSDGQLVNAAPPAGRDGQFASPFRDDGKRGSFSVCHQGRGYKDFGGGGAKGGVWQFAEMCWPNAEGRELAQKLIALSGISPTPPPAPTAAGGGGAAGPAVDPALAKAAKALEKRRLEREREEAVYKEREEAVRITWKPTPPAWPECVAAAYAEGVEYFRGNAKAVEKLAEDRGWPVAWAAELVERELVSYPWERWATPGAQYAKRQKAFAVQAPRMGRGGALTSLVGVGYHQRFFVPASEGKTETKGWLYVPSLPKADRFRISPLETGIIAAVKARGLDLEKAGALVPPVPFVLGDIQAPRVVVLLEGQWDAISFYGACGYFHDTTPADIGIAVFGVRGAQGMDAFLSYWGEWLRTVKPSAWIIADNDAAGGDWRDAPPAKPGMPRPPSFAERLKTGGCRGATTSWLKPGAFGKDFNDYYKATRLTPDRMFKWMRSRGIVDATGGWA